jgi:signal transduction histidine kinase
LGHRFRRVRIRLGQLVGWLCTGERKRTEEAFSLISRKLIEADEQSRTWLARELHDDITQRLCLIGMSLGELKNADASTVDFKSGIGNAIQEVTNLQADIQRLSRRLHPSRLELLGLAAAAAGHCRELADHHKVPIDFRAENVPRDLPREAALSTFRVLQEALGNAIRHSGSQRFEVFLTHNSNEIHLTVRDSGRGFDADDAMRGPGLGLTSMKERVALVDGELSIESQPQTGTMVDVRVPLHSSTARSPTRWS